MTDTTAPDEQLLRLHESTRGTLIELLGIELLEASAERCVATMPVAGNTQPAGLLHGGATAALAETVGSVAAQIHAGPGRASVGTELNATHHRGLREGSVTAVATAVHRGRTTASYEIVVTDSAGRRVCTARLSCLVLEAVRPD
ncbi:hotdog fold thioesterase [Paraoerskovia sediminicola]|nr:hotdog fold thioesterase [Paraoerskovia sediminicola]